MNGGEKIAGVLARRGVRFLFTLCGGHISPILVAAQGLGIRVIDVRDEVTAVFAADAVARLTGVPGVAAVTAGPGATNTITAVKNAQLAQSPVVVLGGATGTLLEGRGSLQDIDQVALMEPHVKWCGRARKARDLAPLTAQALHEAERGVPGPVFLECPVDLLYDEALVRDQYRTMGAGKNPRGWTGKATAWFLDRYVDRLFRGFAAADEPEVAPTQPPPPGGNSLGRTRRRLEQAARPLLMVGSQATLAADAIEATAAAVAALGIPVYLSGMGRGLLGRGHALQCRHHRRKALREADLVLLAGVPCDFRLDYGRQIPHGTPLVAINRSEDDLFRNRRPDLAVHADPGAFLRALADRLQPRGEWTDWLERLRARDATRNQEIQAAADENGDRVNPLTLCRAIDAIASDDCVLVADGGDFVGTASYILSPRGPLSWLDPGAFGTLGVGGGFAVGARLSRPESEVWILYGDGSAAYSLAEFDTFVRHGLPVIAVVGNDAAWGQIAREQVEMLGDDVGTVLRRTDYHRVAEGYGGVGLLLERQDQIAETLATARREAAAGRPVLINAWLDRSDFRKGSISM